MRPHKSQRKYETLARPTLSTNEFKLQRLLGEEFIGEVVTKDFLCTVVANCSQGIK